MHPACRKRRLQKTQELWDGALSLPFFVNRRTGVLLEEYEILENFAEPMLVPKRFQRVLIHAYIFEATTVNDVESIMVDKFRVEKAPREQSVRVL